jgi:hypothetical protein
MSQSPIDSQQSTRVTTGMEPLLYDTITYSYPDAVTTRMTYSYIDDPSDVPYLAAIIECVYVDATKTVILSKTRIA